MKAKLTFNLKDNGLAKTIIINDIINIVQNPDNDDFVDIIIGVSETTAKIYNEICEVRGNLICSYYEHKLAVHKSTYTSLEII